MGPSPFGTQDSASKREYAEDAVETDAQGFGEDSRTAPSRERFGAKSADLANGGSEFRRLACKKHRPETQDPDEPYTQTEWFYPKASAATTNIPAKSSEQAA